MLSLSFLSRILTLPFKLAYLTLRYFTIGSPFPNAVVSLSWKRTLNCGIFQHMGSGLKLNDLKITSNYSIKSMLDKRKKDLPGYGSLYTTLDTDIVESVWLTKKEGRSLDDPILLYLHGGCFAVQLQNDAVEPLENLYEVMKKDYNKEPSILIVDYSLTFQDKRFPVQIEQSNYVYDKLVSEGNTNIVVFGDSAGGNLTLNLAHHIQELDSPIWPKGIIPISPWLDTLPQEHKNSYKYSNVDVFTPPMILYQGKEYTNHNSDLATSPLVNINENFDPKWLDNPLIKDGKALVIFGEYEIVADENLSFLKKIGYLENYPERVFIDPKGLHIAWWVSESVDYGNDLDIWKQLPISSRMLSFLNEVI